MPRILFAFLHSFYLRSKPLERDNILKHWQLACDAKQKDIEQIYVSEEIADSEVEGYLKNILLDFQSLCGIKLN